MTYIPWFVASVGILATSVLVGLFVIWSKGAMKIGIRRRSYAALALGISICLVGAFLMVAGESILGADHAGIATVVGIVGIGIIGSSGASIASAHT